MQLSDDELRDVLARAEAIQTALTGPGASAEFEVVIQAAEEVGIAREAVEQALRERFGVPASPPKPGDLAFVRSADGKYYPAEILATERDRVSVRFLSGGEATVAPEDLRTGSLLPGARIMVPWPYWGPWNVAVVSYDAAERRVKVSDGWNTRTFRLSDVWLEAPKAARAPGRARRRLYAALLGAGATFGAIIGSALTALLMR